MKDIIIIGGGASGLTAAVTAARLAPSLKITVLEAAARVGRKLAVTGNGRCNITNAEISLDRYHGGDPAFMKDVLSDFDSVGFFASLGVPVVFEDDKKGYPMSFQATSVVDALRFAADELGVETVCDFPVCSVTRDGNAFKINEDDDLSARTVIIACGSCAGGHLGSDGGYKLLRSLGHKINEPHPSVVQIKTENALTRQMKGIKINADVTLFDGERPLRKEFGEVLFCDYGLSGPPILQISREVGIGGAYTVSLDLMPRTDEDDLAAELKARAASRPNRPLGEFFTGFFHKKLGQVIIKAAGLSLGAKCGTLGSDGAEKLASVIKYFDFKTTGTTGFAAAQAASGGADTSQFFNKTLMSKKAPGLFACGEVLDVDGDCGGFNLEWCWCSGAAAARAAVDYIGKDE